MIRIKKIDALFIVSLVIIFSQYIGVFSLNFYTQYAVAAMWVLYDWMIAISNKHCRNNKLDDIEFFKGIFLRPWQVIFVFSILMFALGRGENVPLKTYLINNVCMQINFLFAFAALRRLKKRTLQDSIAALIIVFVVVLIKAVIQRGPLVVFSVAIEILTSLNSTGQNPFEIADCTFAAGLVLLMYIFYGQIKSKKENRYLFVCAVFILLGFKRIQFLSLAIVVAIGIILMMIKSEIFKNIWMNIFSAITIVAGSLYVYLLEKDEFIAAWTGLDLGRRRLYMFMNDYYDFTIGYIGRGYGFSNKLASLNTNFRIITLHSDILRMFVELGFIGFYIWLIYYLIIARKKITKRYGIYRGQQYFFMTIYLMVLYFTDNTISYFASQYFYCILLPSMIMGSEFLMQRRIANSRECGD